MARLDGAAIDVCLISDPLHVPANSKQHLLERSESEYSGDLCELDSGLQGVWNPDGRISHR
jgi:hypothetical protein